MTGWSVLSGRGSRLNVTMNCFPPRLTSTRYSVHSAKRRNVRAGRGLTRSRPERIQVVVRALLAATLSQRDWDRFIRARRAGGVGPSGKPVSDRTVEYDLRLVIAIFTWAGKSRDERGRLLLDAKTPNENTCEPSGAWGPARDTIQYQSSRSRRRPRGSTKASRTPIPSSGPAAKTRPAQRFASRAPTSIRSGWGGGGPRRQRAARCPWPVCRGPPVPRGGPRTG